MTAARLAADRVWIVDPLDGTREFGEPGRTDWAVHVALWQRGELTAGAVALPALGRVLSTAAAPGTAGLPQLSDPELADPGPIRLLVSRSRPPEFVQRLAERSGPSWCRWARPERRRRPSSAARPTPTCTAAASTSGTRPRPSPWPGPPACTPPALTGQACSTTRPTPQYRIS